MRWAKKEKRKKDDEEEDLVDDIIEARFTGTTSKSSSATSDRLWGVDGLFSSLSLQFAIESWEPL